MRKRFKLLLDASHLWRSGAGFRSLAMLVSGSRRFGRQKKHYAIQIAEFNATAKQLDLTTFWFLHNLGTWFDLFQSQGFATRPARVLEIGCWEGLSTYFIASHMPQAAIDCVDTWCGSDEHRVSDNDMRIVEERFDRNLSSYASRITKHKMRSSQFFARNDQRNVYDLIYIDGSHYADDVLLDSIHAFRMLKVGGVLIFDDLLWDVYDRPRDNPAAALMCFLSLKKDGFEVLELQNQLMILKTSDLERSISRFP